MIPSGMITSRIGSEIDGMSLADLRSNSDMLQI